MNIEITPELLADIKAKAEKATPGPWCTCLTAEKVLGRKHPDWGCIYANVKSSKTGEILEGCHLAAVNQWLASEEEKDAARKKSFKEGIKTNPGLMGANAEYIAAANPQVVLALIDMLEQLKGICDVFVNKIAVLDEEIDELEQDNASLEKEADWLARQLTKSEDIPCPEHPCSRSEHDGCFHCWREAAHKAVEEQCKSS